MTIWVPDLRARRGPRYLAIADALGDDAGAGRLRAGTRLPTHRDLADRLGLTVGTVTRAYAEAARRGLVAGEVGRGTFVRAPVRPGQAGAPAEGPDFVDLSANPSLARARSSSPTPLPSVSARSTGIFP